MHESPFVTITVPLTLPLDLVNEINAESVRSKRSIPEMLSCMLVDAMTARDEDAAATDALDAVLDFHPLLSNGGNKLEFNGAATTADAGSEPR